MQVAAGACLTRAVGLSYRHAQRGTEYGDRYEDHLARAVGYVLKGAHPRTVERLGLPRCEHQGIIVGKRTGMTENLNRTARANKQSKFADDLGKSGGLKWAVMAQEITAAVLLPTCASASMSPG
jgi:hypothetical protein